MQRVKKVVTPKLGYIIFWGGLFLFAYLGTMLPISHGLGALIGAIVWFLFYIVIGFTNVQQGFLLPIERFGMYTGFREPGPAVLCFPGIIDKKQDPLPTTAQRTDLYKDENGDFKKDVETDFSDGVSAPVDVQVWWILKSPYNKTIPQFLYTVGNAKNYIEEISDKVVRAILEGMTYEYARQKKGDVNNALNLDAELINGFNEIGIEIYPPNGIKLIDIAVSEDVQKIRLLEKEGVMNAKKQAAIALGPQAGIRAIMEEEHEKENYITWKEARELYLIDKGLDTARGSQITLLGSGLSDAVSALLKKGD